MQPRFEFFEDARRLAKSLKQLGRSAYNPEDTVEFDVVKSWEEEADPPLTQAEHDLAENINPDQLILEGFKDPLIKNIVQQPTQ